MVAALPKTCRHPIDHRDETEHQAIAEILSELPADHPAVVAYLAGAHQAAHSASLGRLMLDRMDLVRRLNEALYAGNSRVPAGIGSTTIRKK